MLWEVKIKIMFNCNFKLSCTVASVIASIIIGLITTFLQVTAAITVSTAFLWVTFGIAVVYLGALVVTSMLRRSGESKCCVCSAVGTLLTGVLGTVLFSTVLLATGIVATSVFNAILLGLLLFFFSLMISVSACAVRCFFSCGG